MALPSLSKDKASATPKSAAQTTTTPSSGTATSTSTTAPAQPTPHSSFGASFSASTTAPSHPRPYSLFGAPSPAPATAPRQPQSTPLFGGSTSFSTKAPIQAEPDNLFESFARLGASTQKSTYRCPSQCFFPQPGAVPSVRKTTPLCATLDELVTIEIEDHGSKCFFQVHKGLLCFYSDYFRGTFHGGFTEAKNKSVTLEDVNARTFQIFMGWLHFGNMSDPDGKIAHDLYWIDMIKIWIFADKHLIPLLKNETMNFIIGKIIYTTTTPIFELPIIYDNTAPGSPLRRILIDAVAHFNSQECVELEPKAGLWTAESLRELAIALFKKKSTSVFNAGSITDWDRCKYHDHTTDGGATHSDHDEIKKST